MSKWLEFTMQPQDPKRKTQIWEVRSKNGDKLAIIFWYNAWRQYCYSAVADTIWNSECTDDLNNFMKDLNARHKARKKS